MNDYPRGNFQRPERKGPKTHPLSAFPKYTKNLKEGDGGDLLSHPVIEELSKENPMAMLMVMAAWAVAGKLMDLGYPPEMASDLANLQVFSTRISTDEVEPWVDFKARHKIIAAQQENTR